MSVQAVLANPHRSRSPNARSEIEVYHFDHAPKANSEDLVNHNDDTPRQTLFADAAKYMLQGSAHTADAIDTDDGSPAFQVDFAGKTAAHPSSGWLPCHCTTESAESGRPTRKETPLSGLGRPLVSNLASVFSWNSDCDTFWHTLDVSCCLFKTYGESCRQRNAFRDSSHPPLFRAEVRGDRRVRRLSGSSRWS